MNLSTLTAKGKEPKIQICVECKKKEASKVYYMKPLCTDCYKKHFIDYKE
jgi:hypothetical protein